MLNSRAHAILKKRNMIMPGAWRAGVLRLQHAFFIRHVSMQTGRRQRGVQTVELTLDEVEK